MANYISTMSEFLRRPLGCPKITSLEKPRPCPAHAKILTDVSFRRTVCLVVVGLVLGGGYLRERYRWLLVRV